jgi:hypothetical protein
MVRPEYINRPTQEEFMKTRDHRQVLVHQDLDQQIRCQAYALWQQERCPTGRALDHWLTAEAIVQRRQRDRGRVQLRQREKLPLVNVTEMAEVR